MKTILKQRIGLLIFTYIIFLALFLAQKILFLLYHFDQSVMLGFKGWLDVIFAGFSMDLSVAGYFSAIPALILLVSVFIVKGTKAAMNIYFIVIAVLSSVIYVPDIVLYSFWGFRIDSTVLTYITSPTEAAASTPFYVTLLVVLFTVMYALLQYILFRKFIVRNFPQKVASKKLITSFSLLIMMGILFVLIRGGVTTSTMNISRVYFSTNVFQNHAAINPIFNMFYSMKQDKAFNKQYRFMDDDKAHEIFTDLLSYEAGTDSVRLLKTDRPNIIFILLESFGAPVVEELGGEKAITPNISRFIQEGVLFKNLYASSFRTDRGIVSAFAGFPAQPTMSILKYTNKVQSLNSIPKVLSDNGYSTSFLYGGDVNFAQMKTLFVTQKVTNITTDTDFPMDLRLTKWGVPDAYTFDYLEKNIEKEAQKPYLKMYLTLSSHEPFDVPTRKFEEPYFNSVSYTDSCLGIFIDKLKISPHWANTLVVLIPDHNMRYPKNIGHYDPARHHSFMLWMGGAVKEPLIVDKVCSQVDVAVTLLNQMNLKAENFLFSKDVLNPTTKEFAFYTFSNGFGFVSDKGKVAYDYDGKSILYKEGENIDSLLIQGKAILQCLFDEIEEL